MMGKMRAPTLEEVRTWQLAVSLGSLTKAKKKQQDLKRGLAASRGKDGSVEVKSFAALAEIFATKWAIGERPLPDKVAVAVS
jgi:hypothetical protein